LCFFFQAEDGIRDFHVTGVQTCALPILVGKRKEGQRLIVDRVSLADALPKFSRRYVPAESPESAELVALIDSEEKEFVMHDRPEIGRASCRERESVWEVGVGRTVRRVET